MKTYLKFLSRNKLYTAIEFIGLSVALAFVIIAFCYVMQQYAVTKENKDRECIYPLKKEESWREIQTILNLVWIFHSEIKRHHSTH